MENHTATVSTYCPICSTPATLEVDALGFIRWQSGELIQVALPELSPEKREQLITGTCPLCWDNMWSFLEDDED